MPEENKEYEFRGERIRNAVLAAAGRVIEEDDLDEVWYDLVEDESKWAALITANQLHALVGTLVTADSERDRRHGTWHTKALDALHAHDQCQAVIADLASERNDILDGIIQARQYAFNDIYEGEYGDMHVDSEVFLNRLRPTIRGTRSFRKLDTCGEHCPECDERWTHEDWCGVEAHVEDLRARREHAIASHLHCVEMGEALINHTTRCLDRAETIAASVLDNSETVHGDEVFDPHDVLPDMTIENLNAATDGTPAGLATSIYPALQDLDYCREEPFHSTPHRACRYLIS